MRSLRGRFGVRAAVSDGIRALGRPVILLLQLAGIAAAAGLQAISAGTTGAIDPRHAILTATAFAIPIRALVSGITIPLVLDQAATAADAFRRALARYPTLVCAVAVASLLVTPPSWLADSLRVDVGWAGRVLFAFVWWAGVKLVFMPVVAAAEAEGLGPTIAAAWHLTDGRWWRTVVLGALTASILGILSGALAGAGAVGLSTSTWLAVSVGSLSVIDVFYAAAYRQLVEGPAPDATVSSAARATVA
jgi:hypothetical protein